MPIDDDHGLLLQAGAIPIRERSGRIEVCLITSIRKGNWCFPKGIIEPGDSSETTALREAAEEAGVDGEIIGNALGEYVYEKWGRTLVVTYYLMRVNHSAASWDEVELRERAWVSPIDAHARLRKPEWIELLRIAIEQWRSADDESI